MKTPLDEPNTTGHVQLERIVFSEKILGMLLGAGLVRPCHVYHVDLEEIDEVDRLIDIFRPGNHAVNRPNGGMGSLCLVDCLLFRRVDDLSTLVYF